MAVETTSRCNATCPFCPYNVKVRDKVAMTQSLFEKIIEDCRAFPLEEIEPFLNGEPFVDPDIIPRLEHIRRRLPRTRINLYTNGYALTPSRIEAMEGLKIDHLCISLNTLDHDKYRRIMGFGLDRTLANLRYLTDPDRRHGVARAITFRMTRMADTTIEEQDAFARYCRALQVRCFIVGLFNYKGDIQSPLPVPGYPCEHINRLDILSDGVVTLCCQDHEGEYRWGDVRHASVLEIYRDRTASRYRAMHRSGRRRQIEPCGSCNLFWPSLDGMPPLTTAKVAAQAALYMVRHRPHGRKAPVSAGPREPEHAPAQSAPRKLRPSQA